MGDVGAAAAMLRASQHTAAPGKSSPSQKIRKTRSAPHLGRSSAQVCDRGKGVCQSPNINWSRRDQMKGSYSTKESIWKQKLKLGTLKTKL